MWSGIETEPKSRRWKLGDRVGDKVRWYDEPEEIGCGTPGSLMSSASQSGCILR